MLAFCVKNVNFFFRNPTSFRKTLDLTPTIVRLRNFLYLCRRWEISFFMSYLLNFTRK